MADGELILYQSDDGAHIQLRAIRGTVWLTQSEIAELYSTSVPNIAQTIRRILEDGELDTSTINSELIVRQEGHRQVRRTVKVYNLDMILAVGYRSTSPRAILFRQWATSVLREYLIKGFAMDDERLKSAESWDYFDEWLERIRSIRASEKRFYQKVKDLYATAIDYDGSSETSRRFFATVQNKMLWAVTGHTAAEIVKLRSSPELPNMGLTSWKGSVVRKEDVVVAKNYLATDEIKELDHIVTMYLDYAEDRAKKRQFMTMAEWEERLDAFLQFNERELLTHAGTVQAAVAKALAEERYAEFDENRKVNAALEADKQDLEALVQIERRLDRGEPPF